MRKIALLILACSVGVQLAAYCQTSDNSDNPPQSNVRLGAMFRPDPDDSGATASGAKGVHGHWQAFWSHFHRKGKTKKKPKHTSARVNPFKKVASKVKSKSVRTQPIANAGITTTKFFGGTLRTSVDAKLTVQPDRSLDLQQGDMLVATRQPLTVHCGNARISIAKNTIVFASNIGDIVKIRNLDEPKVRSVFINTPGKSFTLCAGQEIAIGSTYNELYIALTADREQRRQLKNFRLTTNQIANTCEFASVSLIKHNAVLMSMYTSQNREDKAIFKKIMKMTACLTIATAYRGWYLPIHYDAPSQAQSAVAAAGAIPTHVQSAGANSPSVLSPVSATSVVPTSAQSPAATATLQTAVPLRPSAAVALPVVPQRSVATGGGTQSH